ncbi:MAG TPA: hypothetical protein VIV06_03215 [Candidatus Limnocylindrales bacterium]
MVERRDRIIIPVTIASGQSLSGEVNVNALEIVGIEMPTGWDAASITFAALVADGVTFGKVQNAGGSEVTMTTPAANVYVAVADGALRGLGRIKVRSGTAGAAVNQTAQRVLRLVCLT